MRGPSTGHTSCPDEQPSQEAVRIIETAGADAAERSPDLADELEALCDLALGRFGRSGRKDEFVVRFQQTCGPIMAKGIEDTAFYRWFPLVSLCEVGGDPTGSDIGVGAFNRWATHQQAEWPLGMTTLSTHDTKRSEDVRCRLAVLSELSDDGSRAFDAFRVAASQYAAQGVPSPRVSYLVWQNLLGAWPISFDRLSAYVTKALREAKQETSWQDISRDYESAVLGWLEAAMADPLVMEPLEALVGRMAPYALSNTLSAKLVQLTMPGVPDIYQGCEAVDLSLVDPDNRRAVDFASRLGWLAGGEGPDADKVCVVRTALRVRREHPSSFGSDGTYEPISAVGPAAEHCVAFARGHHVIAVATRLPAGLDARGGWADTSLPLPAGRWLDELSRKVYADDVRLAELLEQRPVALLTRGTAD